MKQANWLSVQLRPGKSYAVVLSAHKTAAVIASPGKLACAIREQRPLSLPGMFIDVKSLRSVEHGAQGLFSLATARLAAPIARIFH